MARGGVAVLAFSTLLDTTRCQIATISPPPPPGDDNDVLVLALVLGGSTIGFLGFVVLFCFCCYASIQKACCGVDKDEQEKVRTRDLVSTPVDQCRGETGRAAECADERHGILRPLCYCGCVI